jgi:hypothetical protein
LQRTAKNSGGSIDGHGIAYSSMSECRQHCVARKEKWYTWKQGRPTPVGIVPELLNYKETVRENSPEFEELQRSVDDSGKAVMAAGKSGSWRAFVEAVESD